MKIKNKFGTFIVKASKSDIGFGSSGNPVYQVLMTKSLKKGTLYKTKVLMGFTSPDLAKHGFTVDNISKSAFKVGDIINKKLQVIKI